MSGQDDVVQKQRTVTLDEAAGLSGDELAGAVIMVGTMDGEEFIRRRVVVSIENDVIGDGFFAPEVAKTLRRLAEMIERDEAGRHACEVYRGPDGTLAIMTAEDITGECIPYRATGTQLQASYVSLEKA